MPFLRTAWVDDGRFCLWASEGDGFIPSARLERRLIETGLLGAGQTVEHRVIGLMIPVGADSPAEHHLVPALEPNCEDMARLLTGAAERVELDLPDEPSTLGAELIAGYSLRLTGLINRLALEFLARGRFLPHIERWAEGWFGRWRAVAENEDDKERIRQIADALPAELAQTGGVPGGADGKAAGRDGDAHFVRVGAMLDWLLDAHARRLAPDHGTSTGPKELWRWLNSLRSPQGRIEDATETGLAVLADSIEAWAAPRTSPHAPADATTSSAPALGAAGRENAPPSPARPPRKLTVTLSTRPVDRARPDDDGASRLFALDGLCEFEWRVAVGDQRMTLDELRALAASQLPLVRCGEAWTVVSPSQVRKAVETIEKHGERGRTQAADLIKDALNQPIEIESTGWTRVIAGETDAAEEALPGPAQAIGFKGELRPYQRRGVAWLSLLSRLGLGACLADDMGLGKTVQLLALLSSEREAAAEAGQPHPGPTLLVCPVSVTGNWQREAERFTPGLRLLIHHGPRRLRNTEFRIAAQKSDLVITTYSVITRDRGLLGSLEWGRVALDEAQNIKSRRARQTQAVRALRARHRIALTGTPVENRLTELYSIMDFLNPGLLGPAEAFKQHVATPIERWRDPDAAAQLRQSTRPFILRRLKTDRSIITDLPEKIEMRVDCLLTKEQASLYQAVVDDLLKAADQPQGIARSGAILAALTRLKQVCNHPGQVLGDDRGFANRSGKLARLEEILEEALAEGDRALCFTQFSGFGQRLVWHLAELFDREVLFLHGGSSREERDEMVARFQVSDGPAIFVLSLKAGGTGLNLTAANQVIHYDRWWNPAVEDQATDRAYRIGQRRNVQVRKLTCRGTLEERIDTLLEQKRDLAEMIIGSGESWITEMDTGRLRELVTLSPDAIEDEDMIDAAHSMARAELDLADRDDTGVLAA